MFQMKLTPPSSSRNRSIPEDSFIHRPGNSKYPETSVNSYQTARHIIPEDNHLHNHYLENLIIYQVV
jgi:hypothetical protein